MKKSKIKDQQQITANMIATDPKMFSHQVRQIGGKTVVISKQATRSSDSVVEGHIYMPRDFATRNTTVRNLVTTNHNFVTINESESKDLEKENKSEQLQWGKLGPITNGRTLDREATRQSIIDQDDRIAR